MATVWTPSAWQSALATTTVRRFGQALLIALLAVAAGCLIYLVEKYLLAPPRRFVENPSDVMMRAFGLAHFWVGWLFLFTSPQLRGGRALARLVSVTALGVGLWVAFAWLGGPRNPFVLLFFYGYFLLHEIRDETNLYQAYGDAPDDGAPGRRFLGALSWATALLAMGVLVLAFVLHGGAVERAARYTSMPVPATLAVALVLLGCGGWAAALALRRGRALYGSAAAALAAHRPLLVVYATILAILLLGSLLGSTGFNLVILLHVCAWLVFVPHQLGKHPRVSRGVWSWLRSTPTGFVVLHLSAAALVLVLIALRVHVWERAGWVSAALASSNFFYWSLMHISMAWWRGR